jgi:ERCC4-type nuclease
MIFVTTAANDTDLVPLFDQRAHGIARPIEVGYGDFSFFGVWEAGVPIRVSGDRKKLGDMLKCLHDGRYVHQIQRARETGIGHLFLVLEAIYRASPVDNIVQVKRGTRWVDAEPRTDHARLDSYLDQLAVYGGVLVKRSHSPRETVELVLNLYLMFQRTPESHGSLRSIYTPPRPQSMSFLNKPPSLLRRWASELPGVGWKLSGGVERAFDSALEMVICPPRRWPKVKGIGKVTLDRIEAEIARPTHD